MPRKPLPLGAHGDIRLYGRVDGRWVPKAEIPKGARLRNWRAITNYRGHDGVTRQVERSGTSGTDATDNLRKHLTEKNAARAVVAVANSGSDDVDSGSVDRYLLTLLPQLTVDAPLSATSRVIDAVPAYLAYIKDDCAATTCDRYVSVLRTHVVPRLGQLLFTECTVPQLNQFESELLSQRHHRAGPGKKKPKPAKLAPKTRGVVREVVRGLLQIAVEAGILDHNPITSMRRIRGGAQNPAKAIDALAVPEFFARLDADKHASTADLPAIIRALFGLGCRIGEVLALCWEYVNLDDTPVERTVFAGTPHEKTRTIPPRSLWINATISDPVGKPPSRTPVKSKRSERIVGIPEFLYLVLSMRKTADGRTGDPVFPNPGPGTWRSPKRVGAAIGTARERIGRPDFKSHAGRKTASTVLYANGFTGDDLADQFGHASGDFTRTNYVTPGSANPEAAVILDRVLSGAVQPSE
jgi:integrase